jgi:hypothetical protein
VSEQGTQRSARPARKGTRISLKQNARLPGIGIRHMNTIAINTEALAAAGREPTGKPSARLMTWRLLSGRERRLLGLLLVVAAVSLVHGSLCLVDRVQDCALFNAEVWRPVL